MDKSIWPQWKKDQFNQQIRKRKASRARRVRVEEIQNERLFPQVWNISVTEEEFFSMLANELPLHSAIKKLIKRFYPSEIESSICLGRSYLTRSRKIFPGYYSDRERIIVMLNRFRVSGSMDDFLDWLPYFEEREKGDLLSFLIGIFSLNEYLSTLKNRNLLHSSLRHLEKANCRFYTQEAKLAYSCLVGFGHYMDQNFEKSSESLDKRAA